MVRHFAELIGMNGGDDAEDVGKLHGQSQGVEDRAIVGDVNGAGEFIARQDFAVPIRALVRRRERVLRVNAKHNERNRLPAPSISLDAFQLL